MGSRSKFIGTWTAADRCWLLGTVCFFAGCTMLGRPSLPPPDVNPGRAPSSVVQPPAPPGEKPSSVRLASLETPAAAVHLSDASDAPQNAAPKAEPETQLTAQAGPTSGGGRETPIAPDVPTTFSLPQAVEFGQRNNPRLVAALAAIERARGQEDVAFAPFLPQIDYLSHGAVTSRALGPAPAGATGIIVPSANATHLYAQAELQLQWTLYDFGRTGGRYDQSRARERIAELQSTRAVQTVGFDVVTAYLLSLRAGALKIIQEEAIRRAEATLHDTRSRRAAGVAEKDDVLRAEVQLAAAQEDLDVAREVELEEMARLNNAMGRDASLPLSLFPWESEPPLGLSLVQCLEIAAGQRAEIRAAQEAVAAAQFGRDAAQADFLPKVYAVASAGAVGGQNVVSGGEEGAGLHIDWPIYTGGQHRGALRSANADVQRAFADARSTVNDVTLQVTVAYLAATTAWQRIGHDRPPVVEARENLRLVRNRYRNGHATPTDIVDAEVALTGAQQRLVSAIYEYLGALVAIDYALNNPTGTLLGPAEAPKAKAPPPIELLPVPPPVPRPQ